MSHATHHIEKLHRKEHIDKSVNLAFAISFGLNLLFTLVEAVYALLANSMSLLADAAHNLGDVFGLLLAWVAAYLITKLATPKFSYGYKRTSILAAIINALILVATSALIAYESIYKIIHPSLVNEKIVIIVAAIGILVNGGAALLFMRSQKDDLNIKGAFLHLAYDALISLGVVLTGVLIFITGWQILDPIVGILIVIVILAGTWGLLRDSLDLILDAVPRNIDRNGIHNYLESLPAVQSVHDLHIWGLSTKEAALTCHLLVCKDGPDNIDLMAIENNLREQFNVGHTTIQLEEGEIKCEQNCCD